LTEAVYLDSSALVKLLAQEPESDELAGYLAGIPTWVASSLAVVEVGRAVGRHPDVDPSRVFQLFDALVLVDADRRILGRAAGLAPADLRSLDAIHVATAIEVRDSIDAVITYDDRLAKAARVHGFEAVAPGGPT